MNFADAIAFCALMFALIVAAGIWLNAYEGRMKHRQRQLELEVRLAEASAAKRSDAEADQLEERVRVLERIATDRSPELAAQIEQLRDLHELDETTGKEPAR